jgi:hypothetical protein
VFLDFFGSLFVPIKKLVADFSYKIKQPHGLLLSLHMRLTGVFRFAQFSVCKVVLEKDELKKNKFF